jgi:hypothetical protein
MHRHVSVIGARNYHDSVSSKAQPATRRANARGA